MLQAGFENDRKNLLCLCVARPDRGQVSRMSVRTRRKSLAGRLRRPPIQSVFLLNDLSVYVNRAGKKCHASLRSRVGSLRRPRLIRISLIPHEFGANIYARRCGR
jgi:hypothetical protein